MTSGELLFIAVLLSIIVALYLIDDVRPRH